MDQIESISRLKNEKMCEKICMPYGALGTFNLYIDGKDSSLAVFSYMRRDAADSLKNAILDRHRIKAHPLRGEVQLPGRLMGVYNKVIIDDKTIRLQHTNNQDEMIGLLDKIGKVTVIQPSLVSRLFAAGGGGAPSKPNSLRVRVDFVTRLRSGSGETDEFFTLYTNSPEQVQQLILDRRNSLRRY